MNITTILAFLLGAVLSLIGSQTTLLLWQELKLTAKVCSNVRRWYTLRRQEIERNWEGYRERLGAAKSEAEQLRQEVFKLQAEAAARTPVQ